MSLRGLLGAVAVGLLSTQAFAQQSCEWRAATRASQYADMQLTASDLVRGQALREPRVSVSMALYKLNIPFDQVLAYRDGEGARGNDPEALYGDLCLHQFRELDSGKKVRMYDCPDDTKMINVRPACSAFSACQTFVCVPSPATR
jgi:hypothetical protein